MFEKGITVTVVGAGGLVGGELLRLLHQHPKVEKVSAVSRSHQDQMLCEIHPSLRHLTEERFSDLNISQLAEWSDVFLLALPHGESHRLMEDLQEFPKLRVIDLAADFRLVSEQSYRKYYGDHCCYELQSEFVYGLPEAFKSQIASAKRVANPGCFATAAELLLLPLAAKQLLPPAMGVFAVTGSSGSGVHPTTNTHHPFRDGNFYAYKTLSHQHEPEINETLAAVAKHDTAIRLLAHSGPFVRGIAASAYIKNSFFDDIDLSDLYKSFYSETPFVHTLERPPKLAEIVGTNHVHLHVTQQGEEVELTIALDNLIKGAAGQAIQNMNLMLGWPETAGLRHTGAYPC